MNYGKKATQQRLKEMASNSHRYTSRVFLGFFKTLLLMCVMVIAVGASVGIGMIKGIIDSAPEINIAETSTNSIFSIFHALIQCIINKTHLDNAVE